VDSYSTKKLLVHYRSVYFDYTEEIPKRQGKNNYFYKQKNALRAICNWTKMWERKMFFSLQKCDKNQQ